MTGRTSRALIALIGVAAVLPVRVASAQDPGVAAVRSLDAPGFTPGSETTKGAYYYKVSSRPRTDAVGIEGVGVLPHTTFDPARQHTPLPGTEDEYSRGPLDVPDVYMGGHASGSQGQSELDTGLSWSRVLDDQKRPLWTDDPSGSDMRHAASQLRLDLHTAGLVATDSTGAKLQVVLAGSTKPATSFDALADMKVDLLQDDGTVARAGVTLRPDYAFRPYWRTMTRGPSGLVNQWANPEPGDKGYIWLYPGERFHMRVETTGKEKVRLQVGLANDPTVQLDVTFDQARFGTGESVTWKRVNSIDQFRTLPSGAKKGNEDLPVIPTKTRVAGGLWESCSLLLRKGGPVPFVGPAFVLQRDIELGARFGSIFKTGGYTSAGGESVEIAPTPAAPTPAPPPSKTVGISGRLGP